MNFVVHAPSNIALVKYMGKIPQSRNLPENGSLSLTLSHLSTWMELRAEQGTSPSVKWRWEEGVPTGAPQGALAPELNDKARARMEGFMTELLTQWGWSGEVRVRTANTFPASSGIASSASSFAAATLACARVAGKSLKPRELSKLARQGSGSACRSLSGPLMLWRGEDAQPVPMAKDLLSGAWHSVALVSTRQKTVSSSEAHIRVKTSPLWNGRVERAELRLAACVDAIHQGDWAKLAQETWREAWEMHSLFHTAEHPFTYWEPETVALLKWLEPWTQRGERSAWVTIDAGPNVHVISRDAEFRAAWRQKCGELKLALLWDAPGVGPLGSAQ